MLRVSQGGHISIKFVHMQYGLKMDLIHSSGHLEMPTHYAACRLVHVKCEHVKQHPHAQLIM